MYGYAGTQGSSAAKVDAAVDFDRIYELVEDLYCPDNGSQNCTKVVTRHIWKDYVEHAEDVRHSPLGKETYAMRGQTIERVFGDAKEKHAMRYTPYRGLDRVSSWVKLKYAAMNLKKLARWKWNTLPSPAVFHFVSRFCWRFTSRIENNPLLVV